MKAKQRNPSEKRPRATLPRRRETLRSSDDLPGGSLGELQDSVTRINRASRRKSSSPQLEPLYTVREIAECLKVCDRSVRRYIENGRLKTKEFEGCVRITRSALETFINGN
jgi:excisionase family DNA binding protein